MKYSEAVHETLMGLDLALHQIALTRKDFSCALDDLEEQERNYPTETNLSVFGCHLRRLTADYLRLGGWLQECQRAMDDAEEHGY